MPGKRNLGNMSTIMMDAPLATDSGDLSPSLSRSGHVGLHVRACKALSSNPRWLFRSTPIRAPGQLKASPALGRALRDEHPSTAVAAGLQVGSDGVLPAGPRPRPGRPGRVRRCARAVPLVGRATLRPERRGLGKAAVNSKAHGGPGDSTTYSDLLGPGVPPRVAEGPMVAAEARPSPPTKTARRPHGDWHMPLACMLDPSQLGA